MTNNIVNFTANILVIGQTVLDIYWHGDSNRISPEAPVPVVKHNDSEYRLAGAGLISANLNSLINDKKNHIDLITAIDQGYSSNIIKLLENSNISTESSISNSNQYNSHRIRLVSQDKQLLRVDNNKDNLDQNKLAELNSKFNSKYNKANTVIYYDNGSNIINNQYISNWLELCKKNNITTIYVPSNSQALINFEQNKYIADYMILSNNLLDNIDYKLYFKNANTGLIIINKSDGINYIAKDNQHNILTQRISHELENIIGIEETVTAVLAASISNNSPIKTSIDLANSAINYTESHFGQLEINIIDLQLAYADYLFNNKYNFLKLSQEVKSAREQGQKIIFANGCFDVLHVGHIAYLEAAKNKGDKLFVCINSDCSIKRLKGKDRPVNNLADRLLVLSELDFVDWVVPFYTDTPEDFIRWLKPDVLVKGGDYNINQVVGSDIVYSYGGKVEVVNHPYTGMSSTKIIEETV